MADGQTKSGEEDAPRVRCGKCKNEKEIQAQEWREAKVSSTEALGPAAYRGTQAKPSAETTDPSPS